MHALFERIGSALLYASAGFFAGLLVYMRICSGMRSGPVKYVLGRGALVVLTLAGAASGLWTGWTAWGWIPVIVIAAHGILEGSALWKQKRFRGDIPVEIRPGSAPRGWITTHSLRVLRYEIPGPWPDISRIRIGHVSDLHVSKTTNPRYLDTVVERLEEARPDLLVLTGDFVHRELWSPRLDTLLRRLHAPLGLFASLGNHDYGLGADAVRAQLAAHGVQVAYRSVLTLSVGERRLAIVGDDRPWGSSRPEPLDLQGVPWIGLTHSPDNAFDFSRDGAFAVFSGHLHGGQIRFPWFGAAAFPSRHSRCFEHGHYRINGSHLFVSAGIGNTFPSFRLRCLPDIILVDLRGTAPPQNGLPPVPNGKDEATPS